MKILKKKLFIAITLSFITVSLCILALFINTGCARNNYNTIEDGVIKVGVALDNYPNSYYNENQELVGSDVKYINEIVTKAGFEIEFVPMEFGELVDAVHMHKDIDIAIADITANDIRKYKVNFTTDYGANVTTINYDKTKYNNIDEIIQKSNNDIVKIGILEGAYYQDWQYNTFRYVKYIPLMSSNDAKRELKEGNIDAYVQDVNKNDIGDSFSGEIITSIYPMDIGIAVNKKLDKLLDILNYCIVNTYDKKFFKEE